MPLLPRGRRTKTPGFEISELQVEQVGSRAETSRDPRSTVAISTLVARRQYTMRKLPEMTSRRSEEYRSGPSVPSYELRPNAVRVSRGDPMTAPPPSAASRCSAADCSSKRVEVNWIVHKYLLSDNRVRHPHGQLVQHTAVIDLQERRNLGRRAPGNAR